MFVERPSPRFQTRWKYPIPYPAASISGSPEERVSVQRKSASTSVGSRPMKSVNDRSSMNSSSRCCRSAADSPGRSRATAAYRRTARRSRMPARTSATRSPRRSGSRNGKSSTGPLETSFPLSDTAARRPGTGRVSTPTSSIRRREALPGPAKTCAPKLSQYSPRRSDRMRPPSRSLASSTTTSRSRSCHAAASPAMPPPTTTTSQSPGHGRSRVTTTSSPSTRTA